MGYDLDKLRVLEFIIESKPPLYRKKTTGV